MMKGDAATETTAKWGVVAVATDALYRPFLLVLLVQGFATGLWNPYLVVWMSQGLGATGVQIGILRASMNLAGLAVGFGASFVSDRDGRRRRWMVALLATGACAWLGISAARSVSTVIALSSLAAVSGTGALTGLLYATAGDWIRIREPQSINVRLSSLRMAFSAGWATAPFIGGLLMRWQGMPTLSLCVVGLSLLNFAIVALAVREPAAAPSARAEKTSDKKPGATSAGAVVSIALVTAALSIGTGALNTGRGMLLPIYVTKDLGVSTPVLGAFLSVATALELPALLLTGRLADAIGTSKTVALGLFAGALNLWALAVAPSFWLIAAAEPLNAFALGARSAAGMVLLQSLLPHRTGLAMALYSSSLVLGSVVMAPALGAFSDRLGLRSAFTVAGGLLMVAVMLAALVARRER